MGMNAQQQIDQALIAELVKKALEGSSGFLEAMVSLGDPDIEVIVKAHILLDLELQKIIEFSIPEPQHLNLDRMLFGNKLALVRAMHGPASQNWELISKFSKLRNTVAHKQNSQLYQDAKRSFLDEFQNFDKTGSSLEGLQTFESEASKDLIAAVVAAYSALSGLTTIVSNLPRFRSPYKIT